MKTNLEAIPEVRGGSRGGRGGFPRKNRKASSGAKAKAPAGVSKKQAASNRGSSSSFGLRAPKSGGGSGGGIGMMPI